MPENNNESSCQLTELFMKHLKSEVLDAENMWLCSNCQTKVCATKSQQYESLPKSMMVHLKRFRFDPVRNYLVTLYIYSYISYIV